MSYHRPYPPTDVHRRSKPILASALLTTIGFLAGAAAAVATWSVLEWAGAVGGLAALIVGFAVTVGLPLGLARLGRVVVATGSDVHTRLREPAADRREAGTDRPRAGSGSREDRTGRRTGRTDRLESSTDRREPSTDRPKSSTDRRGDRSASRDRVVSHDDASIALHRPRAVRTPDRTEE